MGEEKPGVQAKAEESEISLLKKDLASLRDVIERFRSSPGVSLSEFQGLLKELGEIKEKLKVKQEEVKKSASLSFFGDE